MADYNEPKMQDVPDDSEEFELGHTDKLVGAFTTPSETFQKISNFPPKVRDWFLPIFIIAILAVFAHYVKLSNPIINVDMMQKQREMLQKQFDSAVQSGRMSQQEADDQIEQGLQIQNGPFGKGIAVVGGLVGGFIVFFIIAGVFYLFARFALKGNGTYSYALVSYGLAAYITTLQHILSTILALFTNRYVTDISVASLANMSKATPAGFALSFIDPIGIWFYFVLSVALAKTFKSTDTKKYIIMVFSVWIGVSVIFYLLASFVPFLKGFVGQ